MTDPAAIIHPSAPRPTGIAPPRWVEAVVLVAATLTAGGAAVAWLRPQLLVGGQGDISPATRVYADHLQMLDVGEMSIDRRGRDSDLGGDRPQGQLVRIG